MFLLAIVNHYFLTFANEKCFLKLCNLKDGALAQRISFFVLLNDNSTPHVTKKKLKFAWQIWTVQR